MGCGPASRPAPPRGPAGIGSPAPAAGNERESGRPIRNNPPHALVVRRDVRGIRRRPSKRFMQIAVEEARTNASEGNAAVGSVVVRDENLIARGRNLIAAASAFVVTLTVRAAATAHVHPATAIAIAAVCVFIASAECIRLLSGRCGANLADVRCPGRRGRGFPDRSLRDVHPSRRWCVRSIRSRAWFRRVLHRSWPYA